MPRLNHASIEHASIVLDGLCNLAFMDAFGARIEKALELAKKDRKALADHLGVSVQAVGQAIRGGKFNAANTAKAARFLGVNWYWLATGDETPAVTEGVRLSDDERSTLQRVLNTAAAVTQLPTPDRRSGTGQRPMTSPYSTKNHPARRADDKSAKGK